jgi:hypothetical protein
VISRIGIAAVAVGLAVATLGVTGRSLEAQVAERGNCTLFWAGNPQTRSVSLREGEDAHVTYVSGGMTWTCGTATMVADSAIKFDLARRVELIGNVRYRDTIRTLDSEFLTYYEVQDLVVATDSVHLTRLSDGSTLTGPRVEFLRAVSGIDEETIATGRPHMVLYPEGDDPGPPFDVDADRAVFAGEEEARAFGDVIIMRPDLHAESDSALFRLPEGTGTLFGSPWVEAEDIKLLGDVIRTNFQDNVLRDVNAIGHANAVGESFEVRSDRIDITVEDEDVDAVWAYGDGRAEAVSAEHHLYGDSLRFSMWAGQLDTIVAVGEAAAVQGSVPARLDEEPGPDDPEAPPSDPAAGQAVEGAEDLVPDSTALDSTVVSDEPTEGVGENLLPEAAAVEPGDLDPETDPSEAVDPEGLDLETDPSEAVDLETDPSVGEGDPVETDDPSSRNPESEEGEPEGQDASTEEPAAPRGPGYPRLATDDRSNWVTGDTLYAIFERSPAPADTLGLPDDSMAVAAIAGDSLGMVSIAEDSIGVIPVAGDSLAAVTTAQDTAADPVLERLTAIGQARSFYSQVRDSSVSTRASRNYMIGQRIDIFFQNGEPERVDGVDAIGLYLDPAEAPEGGGVEGVPPDSSLVPAPSDSSLVPVPQDTTTTPQDTTAIPRDTTSRTGGAPSTLIALPGQRAVLYGCRSGRKTVAAFVPMGAFIRPQRRLS